MNNPFYFLKNCYSAQIEGSGFNFRFGYACFGVRLIPMKFWRGRAIDIPFLYKILLPISLGINYHSSQCDRWFRFKITIGCFSVWYLTKGEQEEKGYTGFHCSFYFPFRKTVKANYKLLFLKQKPRIAKGL